MTVKTTQELPENSATPLEDDFLSHITVKSGEEVTEKGKEDEEVDSEMGNPSDSEVKEEEKSPSVHAKDSENGQPVKKEEDIASAISKANEKTLKELETVALLLKDNPEKMEELKTSNPQIYDKLLKRLPNLFEEKKADVVEDKKSFSGVLQRLLDKQEEKDMENFRSEYDIAEIDFKERKKEFLETAKTLYDDNIVKDWNMAVKTAGKIVFPHLDDEPVNISKLNNLKGQGVSHSRIETEIDDEFDKDDYSIMKKEGLTKEAYRKIHNNKEIDILQL